MDDYFFPYISNEYNICTFYRKFNLIERTLFRKSGKLYFLTSRALNPQWCNELENYNMIIVFDTGYTKEIGKYIKAHNSSCKLILYFHNTIIYPYQKKLLNDVSVDEFWSFDKFDVKKYRLKYNTTFYPKNFVNCKKDVQIIYDVVFVGRDKKREKIIDNLRQAMAQQNIKTWIHLVKKEEDTISYGYYLNKVKCSKAILDITQEGQAGLSLRFMESIFFEKKIITNNAYVAEYDFFDKNNIFIIGIDDLSTLNTFLNSNYTKISNNIKARYQFDQWINRFTEHYL